MTTRGKGGIQKQNPRYVLVNVQTSYAVPKTLKAALQDKLWTEATRTEMDNHRIAETWELVPPPPNFQPLGCGWVHKVKLLANGSLD